MEISRSIGWIESPEAGWQLCRNRSYTARIQRGDPSRVYNVPGRAGVVYNFLEDSYAPVYEGCYVVTGAAGEMWCIGAGSLGKYGADPEEIGFEPIEVSTRELPDVYAFIRIPLGTEFSVRTDYGERVWLRGNRPEIGHGGGDIVLIRTRDGGTAPDFTDCGRIINGELFDTLYRVI